MRIDIITVLPDLIEGFFKASILHRAQEKGLAEVHLHNLRAYGLNKYNQVDDYQYGGGAGMVLMIEPIANCINDLKKQRVYDEVIYTSPDGKKFEQGDANKLSLGENLIILCGHYKGVDQRVRDHFVTLEYSIGDFVLSGGELPAAVMSDAIIRLIPGVLNDETSALTDSFQDNLLAPPVYTRPADYKGWKVPEVLLKGNFNAIDDWRFEQATKRTRERRPDIMSRDED